jgi:hypothetical protein
VQFTIDDIPYTITKQEQSFRFETAHFSRSLFVPSIEFITNDINTNYWIVKNHFKDRAGSTVSQEDLKYVCLRIMINWFCMLRTEKSSVKIFRDKDFEDSTSVQELFWYFMKLYPTDYTDKCAALLHWPPEEVKWYVEMRESLGNR